MEKSNLDLFEEYISPELFAKVYHYSLNGLKTASELKRHGVLTDKEYDEIYEATRKISRYRKTKQ